jgi:two-component system, cell cycle response regulator
MGKKAPVTKIHRVGASFLDEDLETSFRTFELSSASTYLRVLFPSLGAAFFAFLLPDLLALGTSPEFRLALIARVAFFAMTVFASFRLKQNLSLLRQELLLASVTFAGIAAFGIALYAYRDANFYLQAMSVTIMIVAVYLIPNRFFVSLSASILLAGMGLINMAVMRPALNSIEQWAYVVDYVLLVALSASVWSKTSRARRQEYARTRELEWMSRTDILTGIGNRRDFEDRLSSALARLRRYSEETALILLDIDRFKLVNDSFGHLTGDDVLKEIVRRLESSLRAEDSLARWGGEEFVLLLPCSSVDSARELAARLQAKISQTPFDVIGTVTASFGITMLKNTDSADDVLARADRALYRAKESGRNRVEYGA